MRSWPHRRVPVFDIHNWTAYIALALVGLHPTILLFSATAKFKWLDILWPLGSPGQRLYNCFGACAFYLLLVVVITSYLRRRIGRPLWKLLHYLAYGVAAFVYVHGTLIDPESEESAHRFPGWRKSAGGNLRSSWSSPQPSRASAMATAKPPHARAAWNQPRQVFDSIFFGTYGPPVWV